jgi:hypothetical protein
MVSTSARTVVAINRAAIVRVDRRNIKHSSIRRAKRNGVRFCRKNRRLNPYAGMIRIRFDGSVRWHLSARTGLPVSD